jgi:hypothetical protein
MSVAFATKCWDLDWLRHFSGGFERKWKAVRYPFDRKIMIVNNVGHPDEIKGLFEEITEGDAYYAYDLAWTLPARDYKSEYALGELAACYVSGADPDTAVDYLCYVQGDVLTQGGDWVTPSIKILEAEPNVMVVSPASDVNTWHDRDGYDHYMSDQAWLVRVKDFMNPEVYQVPGTDPDYPDYGGNSFEHMVGKYLKKTGRTRKILTDFYAVHPAY